MKRVLFCMVLIVLCLSVFVMAGAENGEALPVGKTIDIRYNVGNELTEGSGKVYSVTAVKSGDGSVHFTMDYIMPKGMNISVFSPPDGKVFMGKVRGRTTGERDRMEFDLSDREIVWATYCTIKFYSGKNVYWVSFDLEQILPKLKSVRFIKSNELQKGTGNVYSLQMRRMADGGAHFIVDYIMPKGMNIYVFSPPNGEVFSSRIRGRTTEERSRLEFDLTERDMLMSDFCTVNFYTSDKNKYYISFDLTSWRPAAEEVKFSQSDDTTTGTGKIHGYKAWRMKNGSVHFALDYTMPKGMNISIFSPPNGYAFMYLPRKRTEEKRNVLEFDLTEADLLASDECTIKFFTGNGTRAYWVFTYLTKYRPSSMGKRTTVESVKLYTSPLTSSKVITTLAKDREVQLLGEYGPWSKVYFVQNNKKVSVGYVLTKGIRK